MSHPVEMDSFDRRILEILQSDASTATTEMVDQVGNPLGIGFGMEIMSIGGQSFLERQVIFDDAVVNNHNLA